MAFRGRGRGRGGYGRGGGGGFGYAKQEPFILFPEIENFPDAKNITDQMDLVVWSYRLKRFWNSSAYYLKEDGPKKDENADIERFSDRGKRITERKHKLSDFIRCSDENVPAELAQESRPERHGRRRVRWNQESVDPFEKLERKIQRLDKKAGEEKKEDENEEEDDERIEEEEEEFSDDGDYNQNIDFDDDEDDFNMEDDHDDEGIY